MNSIGEVIGRQKAEAFMRAWIWALPFLSMCGPSLLAEEPDDSRILDHIRQTRSAILKSDLARKMTASPRFIVIWDFDGTILKGDSSEGLMVGGKTVYPGLAQLAIENGLSEL